MISFFRLNGVLFREHKKSGGKQCIPHLPFLPCGHVSALRCCCGSDDCWGCCLAQKFFVYKAWRHMLLGALLPCMTASRKQLCTGVARLGVLLNALLSAHLIVQWTRCASNAWDLCNTHMRSRLAAHDVPTAC